MRLPRLSSQEKVPNTVPGVASVTESFDARVNADYSHHHQTPPPQKKPTSILAFLFIYLIFGCWERFIGAFLCLSFLSFEISLNVHCSLVEL